MKKQNHIQGIRGIAFLMVFLWHISSFLPRRLPHLGDMGTEIFFIISGFLISMHYFNTGSMTTCKQTLAYAIKKWKKIYPIFFLSTLPFLFFIWRSVLKVGIVPSKIEITGVKTAIDLLLLQSWIPVSDVFFGFNAVSWFISSLLFCYVMTFVFFKIQKNTSAIVIIIGCLAIKILSEVLGNLLHNDLGTWLHYICPLTRTADYFMGMALYIQIKEVMENPEEKKLLLWQIGSIFLYGSVCIYFTNKPIYSAIDIVTVLMLGVCLIKTRLTSILFENKIVLYFGSLGLELYLIHLPVIMMSESLLSKFGHLHIGMAKIAIMFIGTVFCAELYSRIANRIQQK